MQIRSKGYSLLTMMVMTVFIRWMVRDMEMKSLTIIIILRFNTIRSVPIGQAKPSDFGIAMIYSYLSMIQNSMISVDSSLPNKIPVSFHLQQ
jgi:hypothetical protein